MAPQRTKGSNADADSGSEQNIVCNVCQQTFSKRDHLVRHQRSHTGEKPYNCEFCGKAYARSDVLRRHIMTNHKEADDASPLPPLRKSKTNGTNGGTSSALTTSPRSPADSSFFDAGPVNGSIGSSAKLEESAVELLSSFQQNGSSSSSANSGEGGSKTPLLASPTNSMWYDASKVSPPPPSMQISLPAPAIAPQPPQTMSYSHLQNSATATTLNHLMPYANTAGTQLQTAPMTTTNNNSTPSYFAAAPSSLMNGHASSIANGKYSLDETWDTIDPLLSDVLSTNPTSNPFEGITTPLSTDQFWESTPFDFSGLFAQNEPWHMMGGLECQRPFSPAYTADATPAENLANSWPTRPSRRKTGCCAVGMEYPDVDSTEWNGHVLWNKRIDQHTAQRMYQHLENGNIVFKQSLPSKETLAEMIELYFAYWHPNWPMLHYPTFNPKRTSALVMLNMVALGATFANTAEATSLADAIMEKMHESLSFCMSAQVSLFFDEYDRDVNALCQAYMMRQLYWLTAGNRDMLEATQLLHSTVANVARRAGMFSADVCEPDSDNESLDLTWRRWVVTEMRRRTALCFCLNDLTFANFFMTPPYATVGSVSWSLPENDALFNATSATEWDILRRKIPFPSLPLHDLAASLFTSHPEAMFEGHRNSPFSIHILTCSIFSIVLATRVNRPELDKELSRDCKTQAPLAGSLAAALRALLQMRFPDTLGTKIIWHLAWVHLLVDLKLMEVLCGREGPTATTNAAGKGQEWSSTPRARRAVLHCLAILRLAKNFGSSREPPPHVFISLFQAWMVLRIFIRFQPQLAGGAPADPNWAMTGAYGLGILDGNRQNADDCTRWICSGQPSATAPTYIPAILPEFQTTLRTVGFTGMRAMLANFMSTIEEAQASLSGDGFGMILS